jgi:hypothetical protein
MSLRAAAAGRRALLPLSHLHLPLCSPPAQIPPPTDSPPGAAGDGTGCLFGTGSCHRHLPRIPVPSPFPPSPGAIPRGQIGPTPSSSPAAATATLIPVSAESASARSCTAGLRCTPPSSPLPMSYPCRDGVLQQLHLPAGTAVNAVVAA